MLVFRWNIPSGATGAGAGAAPAPAGTGGGAGRAGVCVAGGALAVYDWQRPKRVVFGNPTQSHMNKTID